MATEQDILQYKMQLDASDVEAKIQRVQELTAALSAKRAAGEDATELERKLAGELEGLGKLGQANKEAAGGVAELTKNKEKLTSVVSLLGGQLGAQLGQFGNLIALLGSGSSAVIGLAAALGGLTAGIKIFQQLQEATRRAVEEQGRYNQAVSAGKAGGRPVQQRMDEELEKLGLVGQEASTAAWTMAGRLGRMGLSEERAAGVAPLAVAAGLSAEQAGQLEVLRNMGFEVTTPEGARQLFERLQNQHPEILAEAERRRAGLVGTPSALRAQAIAEGMPEREPVDTAAERLAAVWQKEGRQADLDAIAALQRARAAGQMKATGEGAIRARRATALEGEYNEALEREQQREAGLLPASVPAGPIAVGPGSATPVAINYIQQIATQYNGADTRKRSVSGGNPFGTTFSMARVKSTP